MALILGMAFFKDMLLTQALPTPQPMVVRCLPADPDISFASLATPVKRYLSFQMVPEVLRHGHMSFPESVTVIGVMEFFHWLGLVRCSLWVLGVWAESTQIVSTNKM